MLSKLLRVPVRCLLSLGLAFLLAVPDVVLSSPAQTSGVSKLNLVIVEGEGAINNVRQRTAREPIVQVEDENHKPISGAAVLFTLPQGGPGGTFANGAKTLQVMTDSKGQAIAKGLRLNDVSGKFQIQVEASYQGSTATATINQANAVLTAGTAAAGISGKVVAVLGAVASAAAVGFIVAKTSGEKAGRRINGTPGRDQ
jgi:hypothetical protein